jgi:outer membrane usher protein
MMTMTHQRLRLLHTPCRRPLAAAVVAALLPMTAWAAPNVEFNADMLFGSAGSSLDLSRYEQDGLLPGTYNADIFVNGAPMGRQDVVARVGDDDAVHICLDPTLFELMGLNEKRLEAVRASQEGQGLLRLPAESACAALSNYVPGASLEFDTGEQALKISIPQLYVLRNARGWVDSSQWDAGVNAATLGYSVNHSRQRSGDQEYTHTSMTVDAGLNLGEWRLRHGGYLQHSDADGTSYQAGRTALRRNLPSLGAQLTLGDASTQGDMLQGVSYRGVNISTDARMVPDSLRQFAPVVRGVAQTNARVTIRQRGYVIHETTVAPGPFEIDDLQISGASGDLEVEVTEADGRVERFEIPFTAMPQLLRPGQQRYSFTAGELRNDVWSEKPRFVEATVRRGLSNRVTGYAGATVAEGYTGVVLGAALNTPVGSFSGDVTFSDARLPGGANFASERRRGQSYRVAFNKALFSNNTNITLAAYRYSTSDFLSLTDAMRLRAQAEGAGTVTSRQRSRLDLTVNQRLGEMGGSLYFTGSTTDYWTENRRQTSFSLGYSDRLWRGSYSISARRTLESNLFTGSSAKASNSIYLGFNMPLGKAPVAPRVDVGLNRDSHGSSGQRVGVSGSVGDQWQGNYSASVSRDNGETSYGVSADYQLPTVRVNGSYNRTSAASQLSVGASGGLVLHSGGLTLAQQMGETMGLVHIPGAAGAGISTMTGVKTDSRGYAVVPYLTPFRRNELNVDPSDLSMDVELEAGSVSAIPNAGAVVKMVLPTQVGRNALIEAMMADGTPLPFGSDVTNEVGDIVGVVGQGSRLWVRGLEEQGVLQVRFGRDEEQLCRIRYDLSTAKSGELVASQCEAHSVRLASERD